MTKLLVFISLATVACTSTNSSTVTSDVSCTGSTVKPIMNGCNIDFGTCSDGNTYVLGCGDTPDGYMTCNCQVESVAKVSEYIDIYGTSCGAAGSVPAADLVQAWLDCGVMMKIGSK